MSSKFKKNMLIIIAIILFAIIIILAFFLIKLNANSINTNAKNPYINTDVVLNGDIPNMTEKELKARLEKIQDASAFTVQVNSAGTINANSNNLNLTVANPVNNLSNCYYEILDNEDVIYTSPIMKPKSFMEKQKLNKQFNKGNHKCIVRYTVLHEEKPIGRADVEVNINCK